MYFLSPGQVGDLLPRKLSLPLLPRPQLRPLGPEAAQSDHASQLFLFLNVFFLKTA